MGIIKGLRVADIGSGTGMFLSVISSEVGNKGKVIGVENSEGLF